MKFLSQLFLFSVFLCFSCTAVSETVPKKLLMGAERLALYKNKFVNKNVALVVNPSSLVYGTHLVDFLLSEKIRVKKIFSPEHGFRGQAGAGEKVGGSFDKKTGLPIVSLYGQHKKPTKEDLKGIDIVVFDIQDVGVRFYTYISTMHLVMEACAEEKKAIFIFDRPNPNGRYVDGPVLEKEFESFVGKHPIPIVHGMTVGELAKMINGEGWLKGQIKCTLKVLPMKGYQRSMKYSLPVKPSPNLPNDLAIALYPSLCLFEGTVVSVGRGTNTAFQVFGHPDYPAGKFSFTPQPNAGSKRPKHQGKKCFGLDLSHSEKEYAFKLSYLIDTYNKMKKPKDFFNKFFNKLAGNASLQKQIKMGVSEKEIRKSWQSDLDKFKKLRKKYLIY